MIPLSFFHTTEFYVIMAVVAAAIVAFAARPQTRGAVSEHLLASYLLEDDNNNQAEPPSVEIRCLPGGHVTLMRLGLEDIYMSGAVTIALETDGVNVRILERLVPGSPYDRRAASAVFDFDFLPPGRYHVQYHSEGTGLFAAFPLHVREGIVCRRQLGR